jgi:uncharacterized protein DUF1573
MKQVFLTIVLSAGVTGGTAWAAAPKIQFDKYTCDLGKTSQVDHISGKFILRNVGDAVLKLEPPVPSCGCVKPSLSTNSVAPGEQAELTFSINVGPTRMQIAKYIAVTSNDPQNPKTDLGVRVEYIPMFDISPNWVILDAIREGATTNITVSVTRTDGKKLNLSKVEATKNWISAKIAAATNADEGSGRVLLELKPEGHRGRFSELVRVFCDGSNSPTFSITVYGRLVGELVWAPESLFWVINDPAVLKGPTAEAHSVRRLSVNATTPDRPIAVRNATSTVKEVSLEVVPRDKGKSYDIVARLTTMPTNNLLTGSLTFETNLPDEPKVTVPLTVSVAKR